MGGCATRPRYPTHVEVSRESFKTGKDLLAVSYGADEFEMDLCPVIKSPHVDELISIGHQDATGGGAICSLCEYLVKYGAFAIALTRRLTREFGIQLALWCTCIVVVLPLRLQLCQWNIAVRSTIVASFWTVQFSALPVCEFSSSLNLRQQWRVAVNAIFVVVLLPRRKALRPGDTGTVSGGHGIPIYLWVLASNRRWC